MNPSDYEQKARREIEAWKNPDLGWFGKALAVVNWPLDKAGDVVMNTPGVGWVLEKSIGGLVNVMNDGAQRTVREQAIWEEYRGDGHTSVWRHDDVFRLDLREIDKSIGYLGAKYKTIALAEGAAAGAVGLPGIPPDILALIGLNLRAIGEYATYCGFDTSLQQERLFAMHVLGLASSPNDAAKGLAMAQLVKIAQDVAKKRTWKVLNQHAFVQVLRQIAKALGIRLTKAKLLQIMPAAGAVVGGGFNAYYTNKVCDAAYYLYRERFLAAKHGADWLAAPVKPSDDLDPKYPEGNESIAFDMTPPAGAEMD